MYECVLNLVRYHRYEPNAPYELGGTDLYQSSKLTDQSRTISVPVERVVRFRLLPETVFRFPARVKKNVDLNCHYFFLPRNSRRGCFIARVKEPHSPLSSCDF